MTLNVEDFRELITEAAHSAALAAAAEIRRTGSGGVNYYKAMESLLWNYKRLQQLIEQPDTYMDAFVQHRSKSIVVMGGQSGSSVGSVQTDEDLLEALKDSKRATYRETCARFQEVAAVVALFREEPEWPVVGMYYMNEDRHGRDRDPVMDPRWTWETIALELEISEKTARRWRSKIVRNMSVVMFGIPAAVSAGISAQRLEEMEMSGSVPEGDLDATE